MSFASWSKVAVRRLDRPQYGRASRAYRHRDGRTILILHRPQSRAGLWTRRIGFWCVMVDNRLVRRRAAYGRRSRSAPWRWANGIRRACPIHHDDSEERSLDVRSLTFDVAFQQLPVAYDELPAVMSGHDRHGGLGRDSKPEVDDPIVPLALPTVPPWRTLSSRWTGSILSKEEYHWFVETWRAWAMEHPTLGDPRCQQALMELCLTRVVLQRFELVCGRALGRRLAHGYDRAFNRHQRARKRFASFRAEASKGMGWKELLVLTGRDGIAQGPTRMPS